MTSLTLTVSPAVRGGADGYNVRIVDTGLLATPVFQLDSKILSALYAVLRTDVSPAISWTATDISFFLPATHVADAPTFAASLAARLSPPPTPVPSPTVKAKAKPAPVRVPAVAVRPHAAGASSVYTPATAASDYDYERVSFALNDDDLEVEIDPTRCFCLTKTGTQCSRKPVAGKSVCAQHGRKRK